MFSSDPFRCPVCDSLKKSNRINQQEPTDIYDLAGRLILCFDRTATLTLNKRVLQGDTRYLRAIYADGQNQATRNALDHFYLGRRQHGVARNLTSSPSFVPSNPTTIRTEGTFGDTPHGTQFKKVQGAPRTLSLGCNTTAAFATFQRETSDWNDVQPLNILRKSVARIYWSYDRTSKHAFQFGFIPAGKIGL
jgi:hypothetical protein